MHEASRTAGDTPPFCGRGVSIPNRNQRAAARQLSLTAYLLYGGGRARDERSIRDNLPPYAEIYESSLGEDRDRERAADALRKQLQRDVEALAGAGIRVEEVEGETGGRRYRLPPGGFSPAELDLSPEERSVLIGALRALRRDFPYTGPLRLAIANLVGSASTEPEAAEGANAASPAFAAAVATSRDEAFSRSVARLESAIGRRKRVRFVYYSISRDETSEREVEPYVLSLLDGTWYVTGWDVGIRAVRQFRVSRVRGRITFATKKESRDFEVPDNFERRLAGPRAPWQLGEPDRTARIRLSRGGMRGLRGPFRWAGTFERDERGMVFVTRYSGERQLAGWVLSLGEDAEVVTPGSLKERTKRGLERILAAHRGEQA